MVKKGKIPLAKQVSVSVMSLVFLFVNTSLARLSNPCAHDNAATAAIALPFAFTTAEA